MDSFLEAWNKLKDLHEKEVTGLQSKVAELTMEKCRDTQRIEELFGKNHLLREQQKVLNENVKVLENRLRAGLCDRCTVTQELAKKKQQEFESSHFQSLQHISSLTNEINGLKEDNKSLMEELNRLKNLDDRKKPQQVLSPENCSSPNSPVPLASPVSRKKSMEKNPSREAEGREDVSCQPLAEEKAGPRQSPGARNSPDGRLFEMRISNQLHGTIAVVRPGSRSCQPERSSEGTGTAQAPSKRTTPSYHPETDTHIRESWEAASHYETLKQASREAHLYRMNHHFSQHRTGLRSHAIPVDSLGRLPGPMPKAREAEPVRKRSQEDWEERPPMVGTVVYLSEQEIRGRLSIPEQRERLQYFLAKKQQQLQWARAEAHTNHVVAQACKEQKAALAEQTERAQCKESKNEYHRSPDWKERGPLFKNTKNTETKENARADKPLDLSDCGRGKDSHRSSEDSGHKPCQLETNPQSPTFKQSSSPREKGISPPNRGDYQCSHTPPPKTSGNQFHGDNDAEQENGEDTPDCASSLDWKASPQGHGAEKGTVCDRDVSSGIRLRLSARRQNTELYGQRDDEDRESARRDSDEEDSSDSEAAVQYDTEGSSQICAEERTHFCEKDKMQEAHRKRKRGPEPWAKAHRRFSKGRKKAKALQLRAEEGRSAAEQVEHSTSSGSDVFGGP